MLVWMLLDNPIQNRNAFWKCSGISPHKRLYVVAINVFNAIKITCEAGLLWLIKTKTIFLKEKTFEIEINLKLNKNQY